MERKIAPARETAVSVAVSEAVPEKALRTPFQALFRAALLLVLVAALPAPAWPDGPPGDLGLALSWRFDSFRWNIAGSPSGGPPDIMSELTWSGLGALQAGAEGELRRDRLLLLARAAAGPILGGETRDSDYNGNGRTLEYSRSLSDAGGWLLDGSLGAGYLFPAAPGRIEAAALAGVSLHFQSLRMRRGVQVIPASGPFAGLDSRYEARWASGWLGAGFRIASRHGWAADLLLAVHLADYRAVADWNLRDDFAHPVSFRHDALGLGLEIRLRGSLELGPRWRFEGGLFLQSWRAANGTDIVFQAGGGTSMTRLNEALWRSAALQAGLRFSPASGAGCAPSR